MTRFTVQTAVVTGAGGGLGRALCVQLARRGAHLLLADVNQARCEETARLVQQAGGQATALVVDVSDAGQVERVAEDADRVLGRIDLVVNNAGVAAGGPVGRLTLEDWHWIMNINLWGVVHGCHVFVPRLVRQGGGAILNVASLAGIACAPNMASYNVTKAGVIALSETLCAEVAGDRVRGFARQSDSARQSIVSDSVCPTILDGFALKARSAPEVLGLPQKALTARRPFPDRTPQGGFAQELVPAQKLGELHRSSAQQFPPRYLGTPEPPQLLYCSWRACPSSKMGLCAPKHFCAVMRLAVRQFGSRKAQPSGAADLFDHDAGNVMCGHHHGVRRTWGKDGGTRRPPQRDQTAIFPEEAPLLH